MPRVSTKKPFKPKAPAKGKRPDGDVPDGDAANGNVAVAEAEASAPLPADMELQPPTTPVEAHGETEKEAVPAAGKRDVIATSLNIAKLQAMTMTQLNHMAKDLGVENFGTMRKHEVIFHILQKNAERSGVLFSEGVLEVLTEGFGFLRSQSFNYLPCPEDIYVSPSQIRRFDLQTGNL
ncbi:MAG TPA: Rho termination factor N-terminal domain-containing protein, partial [Verrucomicrobiae bacterium]|nr:Rho termination factor N-terminal domain-containing protein [Verrucomicrobiae bacterium]